VRLTLPGKPPVIKPPVIEKRPGVVMAEADLNIAQVQDLAEQVGELARVAVGHELRMHFRIEVGEGKPLPRELIDRLNELLGQVSEDLRLE
jgi:hypothetical protein